MGSPKPTRASQEGDDERTFTPPEAPQGRLAVRSPHNGKNCKWRCCLHCEWCMPRICAASSISPAEEPPSQCPCPLCDHNDSNTAGTWRECPLCGHQWQIERASETCPACKGTGKAPLHEYDPNEVIIDTERDDQRG